jgi:serine protease Do
MSRREKLSFFVVLIVVAVAFFAVGVALTASFNKVAVVKGASSQNSSAPIEPSKFLTSTQDSFREIVATVSPAVCSIEVITRMQGSAAFPFDFFGPQRPQQPQQPQQPQEYEMPSSGSGFLVSENGYIMTNNHVVSGADEIKVVLNGKDEYVAEIAVLDPATDVAILKIEGEAAFPYLVMGDSDEIMAGDWVMAVGNPFGYLDHTVTVGVISGKNRERITGTTYENFLQTDAAINFGNSGGPLVDIYGRVIGINTAISSQGSGIGFAVPINMAEQVYGDFVEYGEVRRGWIGVTIEDVTDKKAAELGLEKTEGALVISVSKGDPADQAGIMVDDFLIEIDGERMKSASHLTRVVAGKEIGEPMDVKFIRGGIEMTTSIIPGKRADAPIIKGGENVITISELGLTIKDIDDTVRELISIPEDVDGVIITQVDPRSHAARKGLIAGVVITHVDDAVVESVEEFMAAFDEVKDHKSVLLDVLYILQDGSTDTDVIALKIE